MVYDPAPKLYLRKKDRYGFAANFTKLEGER